MSTDTNTKKKDKEKDTAIEKQESADILQAVQEDAELREMYEQDLDDGMEGVVPRLPQYNIIRESAKFETPEEKSVKELVGVIVDTHMTYAYWPDKDDKMPSCFSYDGKKPDESIDKPVHAKCISCPKNQFGSAEESRGKACKNMRRIVILLEGDSFPSRLTIPPTSLKSFDEFVSRLLTKGLPPNAVVTRISLEKEQFGTYTVAVAKFSMERALSAAEYRKIREFKKIARERRTEKFIEEEYKAEASEGDADFDPKQFDGADEDPFAPAEEK